MCCLIALWEVGMYRLLAVATLVVVIGLAYLVHQKGRAPELLISGILEGDQIKVGSRVGGRVAEIFVDEGQALKTGDVIFRLEPFDLLERLATAEAQEREAAAEVEHLTKGYRVEEIAEAEARRSQLAAKLALMRAGSRQQDIDAAAARLSIAEAKLTLSKLQFSRLTDLERKHVTSTSDADQARCDLSVAEGERESAAQSLNLLKEGFRKEDILAGEASLAEAEARLAMLKAGFREEDIRKAEAALAGAKGNQQAAKRAVDELLVRSPADCRVEAIDLRPGDLVPANSPCVSLLDLTRLRVRAFVPESRLALAKLNDKLRLRFDSFPGKLFHGTVTFVSTEGEFTPRNVQTPEERSKQVFRIMVSIDKDSREGLAPGMVCDILLGNDEAGKPVKNP